MVFIHHVLLLLLQVIFIHTGVIAAQRSWILAEGDDVALPKRCPYISEHPASDLTATELINGASNLTVVELINGASNLTVVELINGASNLTVVELINGASNLNATEIIYGASNLSTTEVIDRASDLSTTTEVINVDTESSVTGTEVIKRVARVFSTSSPEILVIGPECPDLPNKPITAEDAGLYCCQDGTNNRISVSVLSRGSILRSNLTISFGCMLVNANGVCSIVPQVWLRWSDMEGNVIKDGIRRRCRRTRLEVTVQNEDNRVFLCQALRGEEVLATLTFPVSPPGKGRRGIPGPDPNFDSQGGGGGGVAVVLVGMVSCMALTTMLALFVVKRRRSNSPLPTNSDNIHSNICSDDVIYANLDLPMASGVLIQPRQEESEYAAIRTHDDTV